jgi:hypothetical protein
MAIKWLLRLRLPNTDDRQSPTPALFAFNAELADPDKTGIEGKSKI